MDTVTPETAAIIVAAVSALASVVVSLINGGKLTRLHVDLNSRLDAALRAERELGRAEGRAEQSDHATTARSVGSSGT